jgi:hypothetical protein
MRATKTGGLTTVSVAAGTATISTTNPKDHRRLVRRLTTGLRTVNDATHAEFAFLTSNASALRRALLSLAPTEKFKLRAGL